MKTTAKIVFNLDTCRKCPFLITGRGDGGISTAWYCSKSTWTNGDPTWHSLDKRIGRPIPGGTYIEWQDDEPKSIPKWCPYKTEETKEPDVKNTIDSITLGAVVNRYLPKLIRTQLGVPANAFLVGDEWFVASGLGANPVRKINQQDKNALAAIALLEELLAKTNPVDDTLGPRGVPMG